MSSAYLGTLETADPLYSYMVKDVMPKVKLEVKNPTFHVSRLFGSNLVYRYQESASRVSLIGKFYTPADTKGPKLIGEYHNLRKARALGLVGLPNRVVRPLASEKSLGLGLMEEYVEGQDLDHYIRRAAFEGRHDRLKGAAVRPRFLPLRVPQEDRFRFPGLAHALVGLFRPNPH